MLAHRLCLHDVAGPWLSPAVCHRLKETAGESTAGSVRSGRQLPTPKPVTCQRAAHPPDAADTQSSTSRDMPRDASYRRSFTLPAEQRCRRRAAGGRVLGPGGRWAGRACRGLQGRRATAQQQPLGLRGMLSRCRTLCQLAPLHACYSLRMVAVALPRSACVQGVTASARPYLRLLQKPRPQSSGSSPRC